MLHKLHPNIVNEQGDIQIGPIPSGTDAQAAKGFMPLVPDLLNVSKCKDFVVNKGHYFGTAFLLDSEGEPGLSDADKKALVEFLKTV